MRLGVTPIGSTIASVMHHSHASLKVPYDAGTSTRASPSGVAKLTTATARRAAISGPARRRIDAFPSTPTPTSRSFPARLCAGNAGSARAERLPATAVFGRAVLFSLLRGLHDPRLAAPQGEQADEREGQPGRLDARAGAAAAS